VPAHVAQAGTLTSRGKIREEESVHVAQWTHSRHEGGWREEVVIYVAQMGTLPPEGLGEEGDKGSERRYPSTLHRSVRSSHQKSQERRLSPRKRLMKTGSCSSLNSQKEPIPTQSPPSAARKIPRGRARVCWRGARGQRHLANRICESCGCRAARAYASAGPYSGP
jgi:ribosomal protein L32